MFRKVRGALCFLGGSAVLEHSWHGMPCHGATSPSKGYPPMGFTLCQISPWPALPPLQHIEVRKHMDADNIIAWEPPEASVPGLLGWPWRGRSP